MIAAAVFAVAFAATLWAVAGGYGILYALLYVVAVAPGIAIGAAVFGWRDAAAWIGGALIGYGTTQLALWVALAGGFATPLGFIACWTAQAALLIFVGRVLAPPTRIESWTSRDTRALCLVLLLVPALMAPTYRNIGRTDDSGTRYYRAYFTADFVWHTALASEIGKHSMPPRNPYMAPKPMHYYWTYFVLPAVVAHDGPAPLRDVQSALKSNAVCSAVLVLGMLFVFTRAAAPRAWPALLAVVLTVLAASAEGAWTIIRYLRAGTPIRAVKDLNIDAITAWEFQGLRIDCLPRSLWYNPQHSIGCALGLLALFVAARCGVAARRREIVCTGVALGLSTCMNPFVGAVCSLIYGIAILWQAVADRAAISRILEHGIAGVPVVVAIAWCAANQVTSGAGGSLRIGWTANRPIVTLLLSVGPVLLPSLGGLLPAAGLDLQPRRVAAAGLIVALLLLHFVTLGDAAWVGFRAGQLLLLAVAPLLARAFWIFTSGPRGRALAVPVALIVAIAGLPTTAIDEFNAQDITNRHMGPEFRWTVTLSPNQREALGWIRAHVPEEAIVQMEPVVRGRDQWSLIPSFGERRMAAGLPISLLAEPEYTQRSNAVREMFATPDSHAAWVTASRLRIAYVYLDETDREAYPAGAAKFAAADAYFEPVFDNGAAAVYRVIR